MRAMIFDLDGTLLQSMAADCEIFERSIRTILGSVRFRDDYNDYDNVTDRGIVEQVLTDNGQPPDTGIINSIRDHFVNELSNHIEVSGPFVEIHGASGFLERLGVNPDTRVAIASGCWRESAILKLETSRIDISGMAIATCSDSASRIEIMRIALAKLGGRFDSVTYFGDAQWDMEASRELGWNFIPVGAELRGIDSYEGFSI